MDVAPSQSFVAGIVLPQERTAMLGMVNVVKSLAASFGPLATGYLAANDMWRWSFFLCGGFKIVYDIALLIGARHLTPDSELSSSTPESPERGISCTEQYSKEIEVKLHKPRTTSIVCLQHTEMQYLRTVLSHNFTIAVDDFTCSLAADTLWPLEHSDTFPKSVHNMITRKPISHPVILRQPP